MEPAIETNDEQDGGAFEDHINDLVSRLENTSKEAKNVATELKALKKEHLKIVKKIAGSRRKKTVKDPSAPKKAPSGFAKPTKISAKLAEFLGVSDGDLIARPDVTKGITAYVKKHNLQKEENKRVIDLTKPGGEALTDLLNVPSNAELTFFNLQKYLKIHFPVSNVKEPKVKAPKTPKEKETPKEETKEEPKAKASKKKEEAKAVAEVPKEKEEPKAKVSKKKEETKAAAAAVEVPKETAATEDASKPRRRRRVEETS
jgi:hypothetical protein